MVERRRADGVDAIVAYTPGTTPGTWQPTPPAFRAAALPLVDSARLLVLLNLAGVDAQSACWHWKYRCNVWHPITAIRTAASTPTAAR